MNEGSTPISPNNLFRCQYRLDDTEIVYNS